MNKELLRLPGLVDPHVHLREPGATQKEDFYTGTCAALAGGYTTVIDMPNNPQPTTTLETLKEKRKLASQKVVCNVGFHFGATSTSFEPQNLTLEDLRKVETKVHGLKLYLDNTTGELLIEDLASLMQIFKRWPGRKPILVHAEGLRVAQVIGLVALFQKPVHFCHISLASEIELIEKAKNKNLPVTCEVTPHHLVLTEEDAKTLGTFGLMKPPLRSVKDVDALWEHLRTIDIIATDHAPHTKEEKQSSTPPFGVPGLETTLPVLMPYIEKGLLSIDDFVLKTSVNPSKIFKIRQSNQTYLEVDVNEKFIIEGENLQTKCQWTPFEGFPAQGKVRKVYMRGKKVFEDGVVLASPGSGKILL